MSLSKTDLQSLSVLAISAAKHAGNIIAKYADQNVVVNKKIGGDSVASQVVTEVDLLSQKIILKILESSIREYNLALLTEESADDGSRLEKDYFWSIDPLDGTLPFTEGTPGYCVSIALVSKSGEPQMGVIYDPIEKTLYHAVKGQGAFRNGQSWRLEVANKKKGQPFTVINDRSFLKDSRYESCMTRIKEMATEMGYQGINHIHHGGAVMNACWVLENMPACYFKLPQPQIGGGSLWDFSATACLFIELGAVATDFYGSLLDLNRSDSTFMNHRGVIFASDSEIAKRFMEELPIHTPML